MLRSHDRVFIRLDKIPEREEQTDRRTDGPTDRQTAGDITAMCIVSNAGTL